MPDQPRVHAIHVAKARRLPTRVVASVEAEEGKGLVGDRYHGSKHRHVTIQTLTDEAKTDIEEVGDENDLIRLHELESTLVYFSTSLRGNANVLNRLTRYSHLQREEWRDVLDDAIVENQQAIEMAQIYREIIDGTRQLVESLMDSRLNSVMERLTSITIVMSIPTIVSGAYGMNVAGQWMPLSETPHGFMIINLITLLLCLALALWLRKRRLL